MCFAKRWARPERPGVPNGRALGAQDAHYDKTKVDNLRAEYAKVNFFVERGGLTEDVRKKQMLDTAKMLGYPDDRIRKIEEALAKYEHVDDALEHIKKLNVDSYKERDIQENQRKILDSSKRQVRIIQGPQALVRFMNDGWDLVKELTDDKFVMQKNPDELTSGTIRGGQNDVHARANLLAIDAVPAAGSC